MHRRSLIISSVSNTIINSRRIRKQITDIPFGIYVQTGLEQKSWLPMLSLPYTFMTSFFRYEGVEYKKTSLIVRVRLEKWEKNIVVLMKIPYRPQKDRINLIWALNANTSSVMSIYEDKDRRISDILKKQDSGALLLSTEEIDDEKHNVWTITEPDAVKAICSCFKDKPLYIADGHHRYESALTYKKERAACDKEASPDDAYNFVMMTLLDMDDPNLVILAPHRLLRGLSPSVLSPLKANLELYFDIRDLALDSPDVWQQIDGLMADAVDIRIVLFGLNKERLSVLTLKDFTYAAKMMPASHSDVYKKMDVSIVDHIILEELRG